MANLATFNTPENQPFKNSSVATKEVYELDPSIKKLLGGLIRVIPIVLFNIYFGVDWGYKAEKSMAPWFVENTSKEFSDFFVSGLIAVGYLFQTIHFVKGMFKIFTFNMYIDVFEGNPDLSKAWMVVGNSGSSKYSNIESALEYRNSKMAMMDNEKASEFYMETSKLNNVFANENVSSFLDSKMSMMDNESKLNFLKGK